MPHRMEELFYRMSKLAHFYVDFLKCFGKEVNVIFMMRQRSYQVVAKSGTRIRHLDNTCALGAAKT